MKGHCVELSNGLKMPLLGLGSRAGNDKVDVAAAVEAALLSGYRHIDTAFSHNNEREVGAGIRAVLNSGKLSRSDIFVVTKLPMVAMKPGNVERYLRKSLELLNLDYVNLYLIHHPVGLVRELDRSSAERSRHSSAQSSRRSSIHSESSSSPNENGSIPSENDSIPNENGSIPNGNGSIPNGSDSIPNGNGSIPNGNGSISNGNGSISNGSASTPNRSDRMRSVSSASRSMPMQGDRLKLDLATDLIAVWKDMERMVKLGLANSIGVCNFNVKQLTKIVAAAEIPPAVLQVECHVYFQQRELRALCEKHDIAVTAFGSLGSPGRKLFYQKRGVTVEMPDLLNNPVVRLVALRYRRTPAQVLLRFMVQQNVAVIPKSTSVKRVEENGCIFNFKLDELDMEVLSSLDQGEDGRCFRFREVFPGYDEHPEYPF